MSNAAVYPRSARASVAGPASSSDSQRFRRAWRLNSPPAPPTSTPISSPPSNAARAWPGPWTPPMPSSAATPAMATNTIGVAIPSFRPLSTFSTRRIRGGTLGSDITDAPSAASVGASAAPTRRAGQRPKPSNATAISRPSTIVSGRPTPSSRTYTVRSRRNSRKRTLDASANSIQTKVTSATTLTSSGSTGTCRRSKISVRANPAATKTIADEMPARPNAAENTDHRNTVARMIVTDPAPGAIESQPYWHQPAAPLHGRSIVRCRSGEPGTRLDRHLTARTEDWVADRAGRRRVETVLSRRLLGDVCGRWTRRGGWGDGRRQKRRGHQSGNADDCQDRDRECVGTLWCRGDAGDEDGAGDRGAHA